MNVSRAAVVMVTMVAGCVLTGCGPRTSRDAAGTLVETNPPKTENFLTKVNAVQPGTPQDAVRQNLGDPDETREGMVYLRAQPGPAEDLIKLAPAATRYEQWVYKRGDSHYHVFFTRGTKSGAAGWEVLTVRSMPKDAVY